MSRGNARAGSMQPWFPKDADESRELGRKRAAKARYGERLSESVDWDHAISLFHKTLQEVYGDAEV